MKMKKALVSVAILAIIGSIVLYVVLTPYFAPSIAPTFIDVDADNDGLSNAQEREIGTDPAKSDSDNDGLADGLEVNTYHTNPLISDSDSDGLNDGSEVNIYKTNPLLADTDGDYLNDGLEVNGWQISVDEIQRHVTSNPLSSDSDEDGLSDVNEYEKFYTDPSRNDTDADGLPDKWEADFAFNPTRSYDASKDPDYDGLSNLQEYHLGTITKNGVLSYQKDLFVEIDCMSGYEPSTTVLDYFVSYYRELGVDVHVMLDDVLSWSQLTALGVSPDSLTPDECSSIENKFHDNPSTHIYVFYAKALGDSRGAPIGWASDFGAFINKDLVNANEGLRVLWLTDKIRTERAILLHEVGHTLKVITWGSDGKEDYCSNLGCIMAGADRWWDIPGGIAQLVVLFSNSPRYCQEHVKQIDLTNKWSVDENWSP